MRRSELQTPPTNVTAPTDRVGEKRISNDMIRLLPHPRQFASQTTQPHKPINPVIPKISASDNGKKLNIFLDFSLYIWYT